MSLSVRSLNTVRFRSWMMTMVTMIMMTMMMTTDDKVFFREGGVAYDKVC